MWMKAKVFLVLKNKEKHFCNYEKKKSNFRRIENKEF